MLIYDMSSINHVTKIVDWVKKIHAESNRKNKIILVLGNKSDL